MQVNSDSTVYASDLDSMSHLLFIPGLQISQQAIILHRKFNVVLVLQRMLTLRLACHLEVKGQGHRTFLQSSAAQCVITNMGKSLNAKCDRNAVHQNVIWQNC